MRESVFPILTALALAALQGCGAATPAPTPAAAVPAAAPAVAVPPTTAPAAAQSVEKEPASKPASRPPKRERPPAERAKVAQLFQVPQVTRSSGNAADAHKDSAAPQIRLLGFSKLDGQLRALVRVKNETLPVEQGDIIDGVEVVAVDEGGVSFQYAGQRWTSQLIEKSPSRPVVVARAAAVSPVNPGAAAPPADGLSPSSSN
jgi:hypothetical protein